MASDQGYTGMITAFVALAGAVAAWLRAQAAHRRLDDAITSHTDTAHKPAPEVPPA